jgi:5'(3')-deoxyribonucleotidase
VSRKIRILLDVDGPLTSDFTSLACRELRRRGVEAWPRDVTDWDIFKCFGVKGTDVEKACYAVMSAPGYCYEFAPNAGALDFCEWARGRGHGVYAVTAPLGSSETWAHDRERWLKDDLGFDGKRVVHVADKSVVAGDVFVDDKPSNVADWSKANPGRLAVLWRASYNRDFEWPHAAENYHDLAAYVAKVESGVL